MPKRWREKDADVEKQSNPSALRIIWATPFGGSIVGFVIAFVVTLVTVTAAAIITPESAMGGLGGVFPAIAMAFVVGVMGIPFGAAVGIGAAVVGGLVIAALRMLRERPSTPMLVIAGAVGTLPGSLCFAGVVASASLPTAAAIVLVVAAIAAVSIWYLLRARLMPFVSEGDEDAL